MKELIENIAKSLVDNPNEVHVNEVQGEQSIILELKVAPADMGKVIGKQGRIAKAIRTVVKAAAMRENKNVVVKLLIRRVRVFLALFKHYFKIRCNTSNVSI